MNSLHSIVSVIYAGAIFAIAGAMVTGTLAIAGIFYMSATNQRLKAIEKRLGIGNVWPADVRSEYPTKVQENARYGK